MKLIKTILFTLLALLHMACSNSSTNINKSVSLNNFKPGQLWYDIDTIPINAHGGGILFHDDTYFWFGEHKTGGRIGNRAQVGVGCYSSKDLYNWKNEGVAFQVVDDTSSEINRGCVIERPKVIYNHRTNKFVMWFHLELKGQGYSAARTGLAVSNNITGPYEFINSFRPNVGQWPQNRDIRQEKLAGEDTLEWWTPSWEKAMKDGLLMRHAFESGQMSRDMTLFVDDDEQAYHIHSSEENLTLHISKLTDDYTGFTGEWVRVLPGGHNEAPTIFKNNGTYYMITSGCTGWDPNAARLLWAPSIWGPWEYMGNPCQGENADLSFHSQSTYILPVHGKKSAFIFMADRWRPRNPIEGRYVWLPLNFHDDIPFLRWYDYWDLSVFDSISATDVSDQKTSEVW